GSGMSVTGSLVDYSNRESHILSPVAVRRTGPGFVSVSDDYRSDWWFSLSRRRVLDAPSVGGERVYRRCLARELVWGRDQEAARQGQRGGEGDQGHKVQKESPA